ncbi:MAG: hypothetical protein RBT81_09615, partial [Gammaproteobacteria bacterium]|nr:hypothetical protein [Gammaproteobacteria bacterium]
MRGVLMALPFRPVRCALATAVALITSGCLGEQDVATETGAIPLPRAIVDLPRPEGVQVLVYLDDEVEPRHHEPDVDVSSGAVTLEFEAPVGQHVFRLVFTYVDSEVPRGDGAPWVLAEWTSDTVSVVDGAPLALQVDSADYAYADDDDDGISNIDELRAGTRADDARDPLPQEPPAEEPPPQGPPPEEPGEPEEP